MTKSFNISVGGVDYPVSATVDGDSMTFKGVEDVEKAIKTAQDALTTKATDLQKAVDTLSAPLIADVVNAKITGLDEPTVKAFTPEKLIEVSKSVTSGTKIVPEAVKTATAFPQIFKND